MCLYYSERAAERSSGEKGVLRNSCSLITQISETFVNIVEKIPVNKSPCLQPKNELFHSYFSRILISFENSRFFRTLVTVYLCLLVFTFIEILIFYYFQRFLFFIDMTLYKLHFLKTLFCMWSAMVCANWEGGETLPF